MFPRHMTRRVWTASILGLAALVPLVSSCGQPAAQKPITVAAVVSDQAKYSLKTEATAMAAQTRAAVANATGIARDRAIVRMAQHRLSSYATATAVTIVGARARAAARRAAIAAATQTARVEAERARAQKTAQAFQAVQARQVAYAQTLETTVFSYCTPGVAALAGALSSGNRAMQAGRNISRGSLARVHRASKDFTLCIQYGEGPAYSASFHSVRNHFHAALNDFNLAVADADFGLRYRDAGSLQRSATYLRLGNNNLRLAVAALQQRA